VSTTTPKKPRRRDRQFGHIDTLPSGHFRAKWPNPNKETEKPLSKTFLTKAAANEWLANEQTDFGRGTWIDPASGAVTFEEYSTSWLVQRHDLAETTRQLYRYLLDKHIVPTFGTKALSAMTPPAVRAWHSTFAKEHRTTAAKAYRLLAVIMKTAVADRLILNTPCQVKGAATETAPERPTATEDEVQAIADAMPERLRIAPLLAAWCVLRHAEVLGLRRCDVDLKAATVSVAVTLTKGMDGTMIEKTPKTSAGRRTVAVPSNVLPALKRHLETFVDPEPTARLLADAYRPLRTAWDNARTKVGRTDGLRFHDLRHSGLTWAAAENATTAELMHRAGHKSPAAAMRYQHATAERDRELANKLAARVVRSQCGSCSAPLVDGAIFCSRCGKKAAA